MTTFVKNTMIVCGMAICSVFNAQAQVDTTEVNSVITVGGDAVAAAAGSMAAKGCYESAIINGIVTAENCYGWQLSGGIGTEVMSYSSDIEKATTVSVGGFLNVGYRSGNWQPNIKAFIGSPMKVEGQSFTDISVSGNIRYNFYKHDHSFGKHARKFNPFVEATAGCRWIKSVDYIDLGADWELFENPFNAPYWYFGANVGGEWTIKAVNHDSYHITASGAKMKTREISHLKLGFLVGADFGQTNKMRHGETKNTLKCFTVKAEIRLTYDL